MRVAVAVAEQGSVTRAARSLHQSSSAVSHTLLGLEAELGVDLFHRLPSGMTLTDAGEAFVAAARRALHEAEVARRSGPRVRVAWPLPDPLGPLVVAAVLLAPSLLASPRTQG